VTRIIDVADLAHNETSYEFEGHHDDAGVSFIMRLTPPAAQPDERVDQLRPGLASHVALRITGVGAHPQRNMGGLHRLYYHRLRHSYRRGCI
jgi:hypothetical protein